MASEATRMDITVKMHKDIGVKLVAGFKSKVIWSLLSKCPELLSTEEGSCGFVPNLSQTLVIGCYGQIPLHSPLSPQVYRAIALLLISIISEAFR